MKLYAAVAEQLAGGYELAGRRVDDLLREPVDRTAVLCLVKACAGVVELWARAINEEPVKAWATYVEAVALGAGRSAPPATPGGTDER